jgi:hypothetical protein
MHLNTLETAEIRTSWKQEYGEAGLQVKEALTPQLMVW